MKKIKVLLMCFALGAILCGCGAEETPEQKTAEIVEETKDEIAEKETGETLSEVEQPDEEIEVIAEQEIAETSEEEEAGQTTELAVFEEITTELTTYPVLKYTIAGEQKQLDYTMYESMYPYNMVSNPEFAIGYSTGDVTGDGLEELIVSIYVVGNTLSELMQDTYVYTIDADINDLNEILYIPAMGGEQYAPGYPNNVGAFPTGNGTLRLDVCTMKGEGGVMPETTFAELVYQDGMWNVK